MHKTPYDNRTTVSIHLTDKCNMRCPHCYQKDFRGYEENANLEKVFASIDKLNPETIIIYGGEPMLFPDKIKQIFDRYEKEKHVIIATNGTIWNKELYDRAFYIMTTVESFLFNYSNNRKYTKQQYNNLMRLVKEYNHKLIITHNIYPKGNDPYFMNMARLMNVDNIVAPYPIVDFYEEQELDPRIIKELNIKLSPLTKPKHRVLPDGTITTDMRGHYNNTDVVPEHKKCLTCKYKDVCPAYKMFPHFCKDVLDKIEDPHFCKVARYIYDREPKQK